MYGLYCTLGSEVQASSSSSTSLLRELWVPLVKEDTLGSTLLQEPLVSDHLHLLSSTINSRGSRLQSDIIQRHGLWERIMKILFLYLIEMLCIIYTFFLIFCDM